MIDLYLMTKKGFETLNSLIWSNYISLVNHVIIGQDKNTVNDYSAEINRLCIDNNISYSYFDTKKEYSSISEYSIAVSWRWIIKDIKNLIVLHDSVLPKYRGFAPIVNSLINGEKELGITALFANEKYDKGDIIYQMSIEISYPIKISQAIEKIIPCYIKAIYFLFENISENKSLPKIQQIEEDATYGLWLEEEDYLINWNSSSVEIKRMIDATGYPYFFSYTFIDGIKFSVIEAELVEDVKIINRDVGKIIFLEEGYPVIVCGKGLLKILNIKNRITGLSLLPLKKTRIRFR